VTGRDKFTGSTVIAGEYPVTNGHVDLGNVAYGRLHLTFDDGTLKSCYDHDLLLEARTEAAAVRFVPPPLPPQAVGHDFRELPPELHGLVGTLEQLGVRSLRELALTEPEALVHLAEERNIGGAPPLVLAQAIEAARRVEGGTLQPVASLVVPVKDHIEEIYRWVESSNPGISTTQPEVLMHPDNASAWLDRMRAIMSELGICSISDLGEVRLVPATILRPGVYIAPARETSTSIPAKVLDRYEFAGVLPDGVLYYRPNQIHHESAIIIGATWNITGSASPVLIDPEVREFEICVEEIVFDNSSEIRRDYPPLDPPRTYWPDVAQPAGQNATGEGTAGTPGAHGDPAPDPSKNGGTDAPDVGLTLSMYLLRMPQGLPTINLDGQHGGPGGKGQAGARGGDGGPGAPAEGAWYGCLSSVGYGGNGGNGGNGGRGGRGGRGGPAGKIRLYTTKENIRILKTRPPDIHVQPGTGGDGGDGEAPGVGGKGGPAGSAKCQPWCKEHPDHTGNDGVAGALGWGGEPGDSGPLTEDRFQIIPITAEQWQQEFDRPHIFDYYPHAARPGDLVQLTGEHFDTAIDKVYFDGALMGPVSSGGTGSFLVPDGTTGGYHPIVVRSATEPKRRSNRVMLLVLPKPDKLTMARLVEEQTQTITGLAFDPNVKVFAEDQSVNPPAVFELPVVSGSASRTAVTFQIPPAPLGNMRGVRRIYVRNPDGGRGEAGAVRIGDTIVVNCAAFRVIGETNPSIGCTRSAADIEKYFVEGGPGALTTVWNQARIAFRLIQPVSDVTYRDGYANMFPYSPQRLDEVAGKVAKPHAINLFFVRDIEGGTIAGFGGPGGPIAVGAEGSSPALVLGVIAHELGHAFCLNHICAGEWDREHNAPTLFGRDCVPADVQYLMYGGTRGPALLTLTECDTARNGASYLETGKTEIAIISGATPDSFG
jgi:hypothetical protein